MKLQQILLVDDDKTNNYINKILLAGLDIAEEIVVLTQGKQALNYLANREKENKTLPELVILDHLMPVMDGLELMQELDRNGFIDRHKTVFLLLAVHTSQQDIEMFQRLGVHEHVRKPLSEEAVLEVYEKYFDADSSENHTSS